MARLVAALTVLVTVVAGVLAAVAASRGAPHSANFVAGVAFVAAVLTPTAVGVLVAERRPRSPIARILLIGSLSVGGGFVEGGRVRRGRRGRRGAPARPGLRGGRLGGDARGGVAGDLPLAARARLAVP